MFFVKVRYMIFSHTPSDHSLPETKRMPCGQIHEKVVFFAVCATADNATTDNAMAKIVGK
jgi:hypothetical protein